MSQTPLERADAKLRALQGEYDAIAKAADAAMATLEAAIAHLPVGDRVAIRHYAIVFADAQHARVNQITRIRLAKIEVDNL